MHSKASRSAALVAALVLAGGALAGCGSDTGSGSGGSAGGGAGSMQAMPGMGDSPSSSAYAGQVSAEHDAADVTFAQQMIPHHQQALAMVAMLDRHGAGPELTALGGKMKQAQADEIAYMTAMLDAWRADQPHAGHGGSGMPGMVSDADLADLSRASAKDFDARWATMMIAHHQGAIEMANAELRNGRNGQAIELAGGIVMAQTKEIAALKKIAHP